MSVRYAILGLLHEQSDYGYRLTQRFEDGVGKVWRLNVGQVYQTLRALEREGLIRRTDDGEALADDDPNPARRHYELTCEGLQTLEHWLKRKPLSPQPVRDELLIRLLVLEPSRRAEALVRIDSQARVYKRHLARLQGRKRKVGDDIDDAGLVAMLGIEAALAHTSAHLKWLEYCRLLLTEHDTAADDKDEKSS